MSAVLAQFNISDGANIPPLQPAPLIERLLLDTPWPTVGVLVLLAVVLFLTLNARARVRPALISAACLLAGAALAFLLSRLVVTDREAIKERTRALVAATAAVDTQALETILDDRVSVHVTRVPRNADKDELIDAVERNLGQLYRVREFTFLEMQAQMFGPRVGRTQFRIRVTSEFGMLPSWWRVDWQLDDQDRWHATRIEALWIPGVPNPGG